MYCLRKNHATAVNDNLQVLHNTYAEFVLVIRTHICELWILL